jgi:hypothetical protein
MQVNEIGKSEFMSLVYSQPDEFVRRINEPQAFIVKKFYAAADIINLRSETFKSGLQSEPSWHPLINDCPDYHRLHDNYPKAYVKQKMHGFYFHGWYAHNRLKFDFFSEIFCMKNFLAGHGERQFLDNIPAAGFVARINIHHYPKGGGYQAEHIDPVGKHAQVQTLIAASQFGADYRQGGVFARAAPGADRIYFDALMRPGDLLVMSPGIRHGVDFVDPDVPYDWKANDGRWMILPIIVASDYPSLDTAKPVQVTTEAG